MASQVLKFPEWRPDVSTTVETGNANLSEFLARCFGLRPREDYYEQHPRLNPAPEDGVSDIVVGAFSRTTSSGFVQIYAGTEGSIESDAGVPKTVIPTISNVVSWRFTSTGDVGGTRGDSPMLAAPHSESESGYAFPFAAPLMFSESGASWDEVGGDSIPTAAQVAVVGQFGVCGNGFSPSHDVEDPSTFHFYSGVRWSAIGDYNDWPAPFSEDAREKQAGLQNFPDVYGKVTYIAPLTDRSGLIFQQRAMHLMTYIGGDEVWQFDTLSTDIGCEEIHAAVSAGSWIYFVNRSGFYRCNGKALEPIGEAKVDRYFLDKVDWEQPRLVQAAVDEVRSLVYWGYADTADPENGITNLLIYNYLSNHWTYIDLPELAQLEFLFPYGSGTNTKVPYIPGAFDADHKLRTFTGGAVFDVEMRTGLVNLIPGGLATLTGIRVLADAVSGTPVVKTRERMKQSDTASVVVGVLNGRTDVHDLMSTARFHGASVEFTTATCDRLAGFEIFYEQAGLV